jgi:hypothetical protein
MLKGIFHATHGGTSGALAPGVVGAIFLVVVGCGGDPSRSSTDAGPDASAAELLSAIGRACDVSHACPTGTICGPCGIATGQCVVACTAAGYDGCPAGSYCSKTGSNKYWTGNYNAHFCVRTCDGDPDCQQPTGNPGLSCNGSYEDNDGSSVAQICNVSNSIGSTHACP